MGKTLTSVGLVLSATTALASSENKASADIVSCDPGIDIVGVATLKERASTEGVKVVDVQLKVKGLRRGSTVYTFTKWVHVRPAALQPGILTPARIPIQALMVIIRFIRVI
ncbi:MAG: hypothetical protein ACI9LO_002895 [Planctomycetota bacterium]|jgi:hypothetical protein